MTKEEANKVIDILKTADGGCKYCVEELLEKFYKEFPEWEPTAIVPKQPTRKEQNHG